MTRDTRLVAGQSLTFLPQRAVWWPATQTLIIADVHLGKAETLASSGVAAPDGLATHDLARLSALIAQHDARRAIVLGDLLHAPVGLTPSLIDEVRGWRQKHAGLRLQLVPGNHDRKLSLVQDAWGLEVLGAVHDEAGLRLVHEPPAPRGTGETRVQPVLCGHLHPMAVLRGKGDRLRLHAFLLSHDAAGSVSSVVLPAFCTFASGVVVPHEGETLAIAGEEIVALRRARV
jgi:DNA ligase-associated metallophosphoesterase